MNKKCRYFIEFKSDGWRGEVNKIIDNGPSLEVYGNYPLRKGQNGNSVSREEVKYARIVRGDNSMKIKSE